MADDNAGDDNVSKQITGAAREMIRVVRHTATNEYLIVLDTSVVPDNAVLVKMTKWGQALGKGAKISEVTDNNLYLCKPLKSKAQQLGKAPAQPSYRLIKRHTGRFHPAEGSIDAVKRARPEGEQPKKAATASATAPKKAKKKKSAARQDPNSQMLQDMIKVIQKHAK